MTVTRKKPFNLDAFLKLSTLVNLSGNSATKKLLEILPRDINRAIDMEEIVMKHFSGDWGLPVYPLEKELVKKGIVKKSAVSREDGAYFVYSLNPEWVVHCDNYKLLRKDPATLYRYIYESIQLDVMMRKTEKRT